MRQAVSERVREDPDACDERLSWSTSTVVEPDRREMYSAVSGSLMAAEETHDALSNHLLAASVDPVEQRAQDGARETMCRQRPRFVDHRHKSRDRPPCPGRRDRLHR